MVTYQELQIKYWKNIIRDKRRRSCRFMLFPRIMATRDGSPLQTN
jgi:hypothetical protein